LVLFEIATTYGCILPRWAGILLALAAVLSLPAELSMDLAILILVCCVSSRLMSSIPMKKVGGIMADHNAGICIDATQYIDCSPEVIWSYMLETGNDKYWRDVVQEAWMTSKPPHDIGSTGVHVTHEVNIQR
jgi:hypothetical protein